MVDVGPAGAASSGSSQNNSNSGEEDKKDERMFECNICLDTAKDAVISMCGHLFCWPCLHQWLETRPARQMCPVCKAAISKEKVIPLYGRGSSKQEDPRNKAPPRPAGQRTEPEANATGDDQWWTDEESSDAEFEVSSASSENYLVNFLDSLDSINDSPMETNSDSDNSFVASSNSFSGDSPESSYIVVFEDTCEGENIEEQSNSDEQAEDIETSTKSSDESYYSSEEEGGVEIDLSSDTIDFSDVSN